MEMNLMQPGRTSASVFDPSEIEKRLREQAETYNRTDGKLNEEDGYDCPVCRNRGRLAVVIFFEEARRWETCISTCRCEDVRKMLRKLEKSGLKEMVLNCTLERFTTAEPWQKALKESVTRFCEEKEAPWLYIGGQSGAGKTHLCTAAAMNALKKGKTVRYMLWRDELSAMKAGLQRRDERGVSLEEWKDVDVLYIDDLFKNNNGAPPTAFEVNIAFEIINSRYASPNKMTILSSEKTIEELMAIDEATAGRIAERSRSKGYCISIGRNADRNYRLKGVLAL